ncbi:MAG: HlyD family efflux transporter periplasmic adaptor subunit [Gemmata sp.]
MHAGKLALWCLPAALAGALLGCKPNPAGGDSKPGQAEAPADIGAVLYPPAPHPVYSAPDVRREALVIPNCVVQYEERQVVSAETDGTIELFASEFKPGEYEKLLADPNLTDEQKREWIVFHPRDPNPASPTPLKRIREGRPVDAGQVIAFMDARLVLARREGAMKIMESAQEAKKNAATAADAARKKYETTLKVYNGVFSKEVLDDLITYSRFLENLDQANQQIAKSKADHDEAGILLERHKVRSTVGGTIRTLAKNPGEYVKAGEKVMEVEGTSKVRIEGQIGVEHYAAVRECMEKNRPLIVEPALPGAPLASHGGHRQPVTGVAVTAARATVPGAAGAVTDVLVPLVVSAGADGTALVWEPRLGDTRLKRPAVPYNLPHPVGVRSVAASPTAPLVVTGADDGKVRIWDVSNRDRDPAKPPTPRAELEEGHGSAVQAVAVSPSGHFFATAAGRDVFMWDLAGAKKKYALPAEHKDSVTAVSFTPQNTLVTASRDGTVKVWKLGTAGAAVLYTLDHRAGVVDVLGVSRDGARLLFDQDKSRIDLVDPATRQTVGQIQNASSAGSFATVAAFGPDEVPPGADAATVPYTVATAGGDGDLKGVLQVWQTDRTGGRGAEVGRLVTPERAPITAAAFSPIRGEPFVVVGASDGSVHLWRTPAAGPKKHEGRVVNVDSTDKRSVTVRVEMRNDVLRLLDNSVANVIIPAP